MSAQAVLLHPADTVVVVVDEADQMRGHKLDPRGSGRR